MTTEEDRIEKAVSDAVRMTAVPVPDGLHDAVMTRIHAENAARISKRRRMIKRMSALAAALAVFIGVGGALMFIGMHYKSSAVIAPGEAADKADEMNGGAYEDGDLAPEGWNVDGYENAAPDRYEPDYDSPDASLDHSEPASDVYDIGAEYYFSEYGGDYSGGFVVIADDADTDLMHRIWKELGQYEESAIINGEIVITGYTDDGMSAVKDILPDAAAAEVGNTDSGSVCIIIVIR